LYIGWGTDGMDEMSSIMKRIWKYKFYADNKIDRFVIQDLYGFPLKWRH
jgi:hypothetical protein